MSRALSLIAEDVRHTFVRGGFTLSVDRIEAGAGSTLAIIGPSGSGKSTLLHVLGLLLKPSAGRIVLGGRQVGAHDREARLSMAAVFQRPFLFKGSVGANVAYGLSARGVSRPERERRVAGALARVGLTGYATRSALALSGGEAQRVSLARALVLEPRVLLLDEPLSSVDPILQHRLIGEFSAILAETDATVVWVTHDQDEALLVADRIAIMNAGRIAASGDAEDIVGIAADPWTAGFLGIVPAAQGTVVRSGDGLVRVDAHGDVVEVTGAAEVGATVSFAVRPEDVLLFGPGELPPTTARNRLRARVTAVEPAGATMRVALQAGGIALAAVVSRASAADLSLTEGSVVLAVFKASAVKWRRE